MHFICRSFLGHTESNSWSQYWENEPEDLGLALQKGHLFALVNLVSDEKDSGSSLGHKLIDSINQQYFNTPFTNISADLHRAISLVVELKDYDLVDISLTVAIIHQSRLYLATYNSGHAFLVRDTKISRLCTANVGQVSVVSGPLLHQDLIFLCTGSFYDSATYDNLKSYLSGATIQDIEENILADLYTLPNQSTLASLLIGVYQDEILPPIDNATPVFEKSAPTINSSSVTPPPSPSVYISHLDSNQVKKRRHFNILFAIIVLVALGVSIFFGARRNQERALEANYQSLKSQYQTKLDSANAVKNLNLQQAQSLAGEAKSIAQKLQSLKIHSDESNKLITAADSILSATGSSDSYTPSEFYDSTLITSDAQYSQILLAKNNLYLLDLSRGYLDRLDISTKSQQKIIHSDQLKNSQSLAENNGQVYILNDKQIYLIDKTNLNSVINLTDQIKDFISGQIAMWNGSLYLLGRTPESSNIWKFTPSGKSFAKAQPWISTSNTLPADTVSLAINGSVWTITKNGQITPFTRGVPDVFKSPSVTELSSVNHLITAVDSEIIAFVEKNESVYVFHKDKVSAANYNFGQKGILDIALDPVANRILVLCSDHKIYQISL